MGGQIHALAARVDQAHAAGIRFGNLQHPFQKYPGRFGGGLRPVQHRGKRIEHAKNKVFALQIAGFFGHFLLQAAVKLAQTAAHLVETATYFGKFGRPCHLHLQPETAVANGLHAAQQFLQRVDNPQPRQPNHHRRANQHQRQQTALKKAQPSDVSGAGAFHFTDYFIDCF